MQRRIFLTSILVVAVAMTTSGAAQPAQASACQKPYFIFFDPDTDVLSPSAEAALESVATAHQTCAENSIVITGHTDRMREADYNVGLSQRMASAVRDFLEARGVPSSTMTTAAFGESRPMFETQDEVSEPVNRRVEITFGPGSGW